MRLKSAVQGIGLERLNLAKAAEIAEERTEIWDYVPRLFYYGPNRYLQMRLLRLSFWRTIQRCVKAHINRTFRAVYGGYPTDSIVFFGQNLSPVSRGTTPSSLAQPSKPSTFNNKPTHTAAAKGQSNHTMQQSPPICVFAFFFACRGHMAMPLTSSIDSPHLAQALLPRPTSRLWLPSPYPSGLSTSPDNHPTPLLLRRRHYSAKKDAKSGRAWCRDTLLFRAFNSPPSCPAHTSSHTSSDPQRPWMPRRFCEVNSMGGDVVLGSAALRWPVASVAVGASPPILMKVGALLVGPESEGVCVAIVICILGLSPLRQPGNIHKYGGGSESHKLCGNSSDAYELFGLHSFLGQYPGQQHFDRRRRRFCAKATLVSPHHDRRKQRYPPRTPAFPALLTFSVIRTRPPELQANPFQRLRSKSQSHYHNPMRLCLRG
ncbi:hypothetical protein CYLTODRAFT_480811 [Cylindrobasidium torrendii FP15055 ss-10]|uniref:Uncharacterized protein n=1 Tax=Cylindrobasidium torrendii FP15055 ss-10 TaxID=1314674 RepID=A0A0D7AUT2_9AGAR|nr:hypothetical protein CYLTODRAFT_480811 [Cylindrobasidium torrendii FP15055 ss-10]